MNKEVVVFAVTLNINSEAEVAWLKSQLHKDDIELGFGFYWGVEHPLAPGFFLQDESKLIIHSRKEYGDFEKASEFIQQYLKAFHKESCFSLTWAHIEEKDVADKYAGGGVAFITAEDIRYDTTSAIADNNEQEHLERYSHLTNRCGECKNCLELEKTRQLVLAFTNPPFSSADNDVIQLWNSQLKHLMCKKAQWEKKVTLRVTMTREEWLAAIDAIALRRIEISRKKNATSYEMDDLEKLQTVEDKLNTEFDAKSSRAVILKT